MLQWLAEGKTGAEIETILGCKIGIANKYSERIVAQLGVEARTAAARTTLEALGRRAPG